MPVAGDRGRGVRDENECVQVSRETIRGPWVRPWPKRWFRTKVLVVRLVQSPRGETSDGTIGEGNMVGGAATNPIQSDLINSERGTRAAVKRVWTANWELELGLFWGSTSTSLTCYSGSDPLFEVD